MKKLIFALVTITVIGAAGYIFYPGQTVGASEGHDGGGAPQAMPVETVTIKPQAIQLWKSFSGSIVAVDQAEIRPQVSGRITEIKFEDGQHVEKGDVLIIIDPRPYEATVNQAIAALKTAENQAALAKKEFDRAKNLIKTEAISQSLMDERSNDYDDAKALVQGAKAVLQLAEVNLDYAFVKAPISGKVSRAEITEGNLVQSGAGAPLLTTVVSNDVVYADFEVDENTYIQSIRNLGDKKISDIPVRINILDGELEYKGKIHSVDNRIDATSGTIRVRSIFENKDKLLLPGMTVTVAVGSPADKKQIIITERAIGTDQDRKFVYVIENGVATYRQVSIGESTNGSRIVQSGLKEGDVVISEGIVRLRPNTPVVPKSQMQKPPRQDKSAKAENHEE